MEAIAGTAYLYNLSVVAMTFATVSALVMIMRQAMGGRLSNFDVYLITIYVALAFVVAITAMLPPLVAMFVSDGRVLWMVASGCSAAVMVVVLASAMRLRFRASSMPISRGVAGVFAGYWLSAVVMAANVVPSPLQGSGLHVVADTAFLAILMTAFVRRIASLLGDKPGEDWDPRRG